MSTESSRVPAHCLCTWVLHPRILPWRCLCQHLNADITSTWRDGLGRDDGLGRVGMCMAGRHRSSSQTHLQVPNTPRVSRAVGQDGPGCPCGSPDEGACFSGCLLWHAYPLCLLPVCPPCCHLPRPHGRARSAAAAPAPRRQLGRSRPCPAESVTQAAWHLPRIYLDTPEPAAQFIHLFIYIFFWGLISCPFGDRF